MKGLAERSAGLFCVEADKYDPSLPMAYKLAAFFEIPVEQLFFNPWRASSS